VTVIDSCKAGTSPPWLPQAAPWTDGFFHLDLLR
jgi:hypothetical protein